MRPATSSNLPAPKADPFFRLQPPQPAGGGAAPSELQAMEFACGRAAMRVALLESPEGDTEIQPACLHIGDAFAQAIEILGPHKPQDDIKALSERVAALERIASSGQSK